MLTEVGSAAVADAAVAGALMPSDQPLIKDGKWRIWLAIVSAVLLLALAAVAALYAFFGAKAVPGTTLSGVDVGGMDKAGIELAAIRIFDTVVIDFSLDGNNVSVRPEDVGISLNAGQTAENALDNGKFLAGYLVSPYMKENIDLAIDYNPAGFRDFILAHFPESAVACTNPSGAYDPDAGVFSIVQGQGGRNIADTDIEAFMQGLIAEPGEKAFDVRITDVAPLVTDETAQKAVDFANTRIGVTINFVVDGVPVATVPRDNIASWINFDANDYTKEINTCVDPAKVVAFLDNNPIPGYTSNREDRRVIKNAAGVELLVLFDGVDGVTLDGKEQIAQAFAQDVIEGKDINQSFVMAPDPAVTVNDDSYHWLDVNLSSQTLTMYEGAKPVNTFLISSGKRVTPSDVGTFRVWYKVQSKTYHVKEDDGREYDVPNVKYSLFYNGGEAVHAAYWHNNFGQPMSHGCINMRTEEAEIVYGFSELGTIVNVHY
ncbi:MAG: L,D-transpeptidase [Clostridiales Family XIII bacterium]|jgi:lipoprotein-anchoring transpeptidase ErfK/SrfK|nr:L,D-transpeptidase [Clostridiales Family XIII bacterium]